MDNNRQTANSTAVKGITALYSRLSREDSLDGQSLSIQNQRQILEDYAKSQGFTNMVHFVDDGTTGVRFEREAWQELISEVENGNVSHLITKEPLNINIAFSNWNNCIIPFTMEVIFLNIYLRKFFIGHLDSSLIFVFI